MRFLDHTWTWDWCREHGFPLDEPDGPVAPRLANDPSLTHRERPVHSAAADSEKAHELAIKLAASLGDWDECLLWATDWDVWPNEENWPRYYAWRAQFAERRSVGEAPGHLFDRSDMSALTEFLAHVIECGWDVTILPSKASQATGLRIRTSHDEWIELLSVSPVRFSVAAG
jgi:hypothetical protein